MSLASPPRPTIETLQAWRREGEKVAISRRDNALWRRGGDVLIAGIGRGYNSNQFATERKRLPVTGGDETARGA